MEWMITLPANHQFVEDFKIRIDYLDTYQRRLFESILLCVATLTVGPIMPWGRGLRGLVHEKAHHVCLNVSSLP